MCRVISRSVLAMVRFTNWDAPLQVQIVRFGSVRFGSVRFGSLRCRRRCFVLHA